MHASIREVDGPRSRPPSPALTPLTAASLTPPPSGLTSLLRLRLRAGSASVEACSLTAHARRGRGAVACINALVACVSVDKGVGALKGLHEAELLRG